MAASKLTLGQSIDQLIAALEPLDPVTRRTALEAVCNHLDIKLVANLGTNVPKPPNPTHLHQSNSGAQDKPQPQTPSSTIKKDIRSLKEEKQPDTAGQMACLVAYYLKEIAPQDERKDAVSASDLEKYFIQAGFKLPKRMQQVLVDAKAAGYLDSATQRGEYKLNAVGHNLVVHNLPKKNGANK